MKEMNRDLFEHAIDQWILGRNAERDRIILKIYLFDGITFEKMQQRLDKMAEDQKDPKYALSIDQLKKIVRKRKFQLFKHV